MNSDFANYVREASFHLTLSQQMIYHLLATDRDENDKRFGYGAIINRACSNALYRRGLIVPAGKVKIPEGCEGYAGWPYDYNLTEAGKLVVGLLKEAGFKADPSVCEEEDITEVKVTLK